MCKYIVLVQFNHILCLFVNICIVLVNVMLLSLVAPARLLNISVILMFKSKCEYVHINMQWQLCLFSIKLYYTIWYWNTNSYVGLPIYNGKATCIFEGIVVLT